MDAKITVTNSERRVKLTIKDQEVICRFLRLLQMHKNLEQNNNKNGCRRLFG